MVKKRLSTLLILVCIAVSGCDKEEFQAETFTTFDTYFKSSYSEKVLVGTESEKLLFEVLSLADSRCKSPEDLPQGNATIRIKLSATTNNAAEASLCLGECGEVDDQQSDSVMVYLKDASYKVKLNKIDESTAQNPASAELMIHKF